MESYGNEIVLIRGLPGSGKSTMAKSMAGYLHFESDMFFVTDGHYAYDALKIRQAHDWCEASAKAAIEEGKNVVVSNTFMKKWELQPYIDFGYPFRVIEMDGKWPNLHEVSDDVIKTMISRWEKLPEEWIR